MPYADSSQMTARFGTTELARITDKENATTLDIAVLNDALDDASAEIDGYIGARYSLPLTSVPERLVIVCCDIARWYLYDEMPTDIVKERYENAIRFLRDVAAGKAVLEVDPPATNNDLPETDAPDRVFTTETLRDF